MSTNEVKNLLEGNAKNQFKERSISPFSPDMPLYMMFHLYGNEIRSSFRGQITSISYGKQAVNGEYGYRYKTYTDEEWNRFSDESFCFYFENNKLFGVQSLFRGSYVLNVLNELQSKHGSSSQYTMTDWAGRPEYIMHIWENNNRFIVLCSAADSSNIVYVGYFDSAILRRICLNAMEEKRGNFEEQRTRSRLE